MCRLFGFRSVLESGVHQSLVSADNAIIDQSDRHPDGWGVAYYKMGSPHVIKMDKKAKGSRLFEKVSGVVSSKTVLAHLRKSTVGSLGPLNTHPFQFGPWVFAHNGHVENFAQVRPQFLEKVHEDLRPFLLGDTDSELLFLLLLTHLRQEKGFEEGVVSTQTLISVLKRLVQDFVEVAGSLKKDSSRNDLNYLTFILTDGSSLLGFQGGQRLRYSTHKTRCSERDSCAFHSPVCEARSEPSQKIHHLLVSSEVIQNENVWEEMEFGEYVGVDTEMRFFKGQLDLTEMIRP